jgi:hypothetical protein
LREAEILNEVVILLENIKNRQPCSGKYGKKTQNGLYLINTRWKSKKIEFDMNTIDSALKSYSEEWNLF